MMLIGPIPRATTFAALELQSSMGGGKRIRVSATNGFKIKTVTEDILRNNIWLCDG
jgi:hypothetical protein